MTGAESLREVPRAAPDVTSHESTLEAGEVSRRRPTIAVTVGYDLPHNAERIGVRASVLHALLAAGASIRIVPPLGEDVLASGVLDELDGILLPGGVDPDPALWGEEPHPTTVIDDARDALELPLVRAAVDRRIPVLGICRGAQVVNAALGGTLLQDIPPGPIDHRGPADRSLHVHGMRIQPGTRLHEVLGTDEIAVNSVHHQAVAKVASGLRASAWSEDGYIEAIEWNSEEYWLLAVQYHPEDLHRDEVHARLFSKFVDAAVGYREAARRSTS
ncbi:gamma-glutamyl-gamma-aminobutyrate hydrolase family protein [Kribbella sp. NPDC050820]|uniref:gamma-glutamyl-gamma-aminobutyrate hydrolase family protein n=1 Tax=Kribbella sp. NPDC050820 TaxID=3155408 RepID=UPI0033E3ED4D